jgi:hypothetical protein
VAISHRESSSFAEITLRWPAPVEHTASVNGRELLLQFNRAIETPENTVLPEQLPLWIESVVLGFDTMLIRASRDVTYDVRAEGDALVIRLDTAPAREPVSGPEAEEGELRLQILRAQLLTARRQHGLAQHLLEELIANHPGNVPALSNLAQLEQQIGRWRRSSGLLDRVLQIDPHNEEARELRSEVLAEHASRIRAEAEIKSVSAGRTEHISRFSAHALLKSDLRLGMAVDYNHTTSSSGIYNRQRTELYLRRDFQRGSDIRLSGFGTRGQVGGGFRYSRTDYTGNFHAQAEYRRPFWEFLESIAGYGVRDRAEIHRNQRLDRMFDSRLTVALNRYGIDGNENIARSLAFDGGISRAVLHSNPHLALEYSFDKESVRGLDPGTIPLVSREVHAASIMGQVRFTRRLAAEGFWGFVRDRLGEHAQGPVVGSRLTRAGSSRLGFQFWFERRRNSVATGQIVNRAGAHVYWRFQ